MMSLVSRVSRVFFRFAGSVAFCWRTQRVDIECCVHSTLEVRRSMFDVLNNIGRSEKFAGLRFHLHCPPLTGDAGNSDLKATPRPRSSHNRSCIDQLF